jgi:beta-glucosidase
MGKATLSGNTLRVSIRNTGTRAGKQVVQLYVAPQKPVVARPVKELKAFRKVSLQPGEEQVVEFNLTEQMFQYFDADVHKWVTGKGAYKLMVGTAADAIHSEVAYNLF